MYLDLTDAAETMLAEAPPESLEAIEEEALKSHVLGLDNEVGYYAFGDVIIFCLCIFNAFLRLHQFELKCLKGGQRIIL